MQTVETTSVQYIPGKTLVVTKTEYVPEYKTHYQTRTVPYYVTSTSVYVKQELTTVNKVVPTTVHTTQVGYTTEYRQEVSHSVVQVPVVTTAYETREVTSVVYKPGTTRTVYLDTTVYRTSVGPKVVKTKVDVSTIYQDRYITVTSTATQVKEHLKTQYVKDCGGYQHQQPYPSYVY